MISSCTFKLWLHGSPEVNVTVTCEGRVIPDIRTIEILWYVNEGIMCAVLQRVLSTLGGGATLGALGAVLGYMGAIRSALGVLSTLRGCAEYIGDIQESKLYRIMYSSSPSVLSNP